MEGAEVPEAENGAAAQTQLVLDVEVEKLARALEDKPHVEEESHRPKGSLEREPRREKHRVRSHEALLVPRGKARLERERRSNEGFLRIEKEKCAAECASH